MFQSMGCTLQARPQEPPEVYSNVLPLSVGDTTGGIHPMPSGINIFAPPEVNIPKAPQVNTAPRGRKTVGKQLPKKRSRLTRLLPKVKSDYDFQNKIYYHGSHNCPKQSCAPLVETRNILLWRVFDVPHDILVDSIYL